MGCDTRLFEIDPRSRLFELLRSDGRLTRHLMLLELRYVCPELFEEEREFSHEYAGVLEAIDRMLGDDPDLRHRWIDLPNHYNRFSGPLEIIAQRSAEASLVDFMFRGEREFEPGRHVHLPARWIDTERCRDIAEWLDTVSATEIGVAARLSHERNFGKALPWPGRTNLVQRVQHGKVREFHDLFAGAAARGNVVVVLVQ